MKSKRQKKRGGDGHGEASGDNSKIVIRWRSLSPGRCDVWARAHYSPGPQSDRDALIVYA